jgi:hypothetical protein
MTISPKQIAIHIAERLMNKNESRLIDNQSYSGELAEWSNAAGSKPAGLWPFP